MELKKVIHLLQARWKSIVALLIIGLVVAGAISAITTKKYESTAQIYVSTDSTNTTTAYTGSAYLTAKLASYAALATQSEMMTRTAKALDDSQASTGLAGKVSVSVPTGESLLKVTATDTNPVRAQHIAAVVASQLSAYIQELETASAGQSPTVRANVTDQPVVNPTPVSPRTALNLILGALVGLLLGVGLAGVRHALDNTVKTDADAEAIADAPLLARMPKVKGNASADVAADESGFSPAAEAFRVLRTNLQFANLDHQPRSIVVTSSSAGEGKTYTAANLAVALAKTGTRVALVDCDLRRPQLGPLLGLDSAVGLTSVLIGKVTLDEALQSFGRVSFLASGPIPPNPTEVLQTQVARDLLQELSSRFDVVIIDAPPLLPVIDAGILATSVDGVLLVAHQGKTRRDELAEARRRLGAVGARVFGVVLNMATKSGTGYYYYGTGYASHTYPSHSEGHHRESVR